MVTLGHWSGRPLSCVTAQHWNMFPHLAPSLPSVQRKSVDGAASGAWNSPYFSYLEIFYLHPPTYPPSLARTSLLFIFIHFSCILVHFISSYHEAAFNEMFLEDSWYFPQDVRMLLRHRAHASSGGGGGRVVVLVNFRFVLVAMAAAAWPLVASSRILFPKWGILFPAWKSVKSSPRCHRTAPPPLRHRRSAGQLVTWGHGHNHNTTLHPHSLSISLSTYFLSFRSINSNVKCHTPRYKISYDVDYYLQVLFGVELIFPWLSIPGNQHHSKVSPTNFLSRY